MIFFIIFVIVSNLVSPSVSNCFDYSNISFSSFGSQNCGAELNCMGTVTIENGDIRLTEDDPSATKNQVGRVLYKSSVLAWPASICTEFNIQIVSNTTEAGDGMAFIFAQDSKPSPEFSFGSYMGIFDQNTAGVLRQLAIEFDTYKNENEADDNHIAIDTKNMEKPPAVQSLNKYGINLKSGREITFKIMYDGWTKKMQIYGAYKNESLMSILNHTIKLQHIVPSSVYVGFTASTGTLMESHRVLSWNFTSIQLPNNSLDKKKNVMLISVITSIVGILMIIGVITPFVLKARKKYREAMARKRDIEALIASSNGPKLFAYRKLARATRNYSKEYLLGTGGFGSVYKGILSDNSTIAVKKISSTSTQGEKEYLAEICTIGRLRHKNLVQLQGWCHDRNQLLLVYEYMPNGSLDRYIGKIGNFLNWEIRYKILSGLASALVYLHEECGNTVVHRDVKPNNVMLDGEFIAHLGDFGLARLIQNEAMHTTMIAGTPGYLAPEVSFTGRATTESDVYSFGMVVLEVICGRRSNMVMDEFSIIEFVWNLYERGELFECVDKSLKGNYDEDQMMRTLVVGLACLHPDYSFRPRMRKVVQIFLNSDEPLMSLPKTRPCAVNLSYNSFSSTNTTTNFGSNSSIAGGSKENLAEEAICKYDSST